MAPPLPRPLPQGEKDLGALVGGSREKVNHQPRQWEQAGPIGKDRGYIVLARPDRLTSDAAAA